MTVPSVTDSPMAGINTSSDIYFLASLVNSRRTTLRAVAYPIVPDALLRPLHPESGGRGLVPRHLQDRPPSPQSAGLLLSILQHGRPPCEFPRRVRPSRAQPRSEERRAGKQCR